jgi:hypothetical protein
MINKSVPGLRQNVFHRYMAKRPSKIGSLTSTENRVVMSHYTVVSLNDHDFGLDVAVKW